MSAINLAFFIAAAYFLLIYFNRLSEDLMQSMISLTDKNRAFRVTLWSDPRVPTKLEPPHNILYAKKADPWGHHYFPLPLSSVSSYHLSHINYANDAVYDSESSLQIKDYVDPRVYQWDCSCCSSYKHDSNVLGVDWGWNENQAGISDGICRVWMHRNQSYLLRSELHIRPLPNCEKSFQVAPYPFWEPR
jgi:hypothetical protein